MTDPIQDDAVEVLDHPVRSVTRHGVAAVPEHATLESVGRVMANIVAAQEEP